MAKADRILMILLPSEWRASSKEDKKTDCPLGIQVRLSRSTKIGQRPQRHMALLPLDGVERN